MSKERRPMGFFEPFNRWWSDFYNQNGRRPTKADIETWRAENLSWRPELTMEEILHHSKGRRDPERNRSYFVEYRRKVRASAKTPASKPLLQRSTAGVADPTSVSDNMVCVAAPASSCAQGLVSNIPHAPPAPELRLLSSTCCTTAEDAVTTSKRTQPGDADCAAGTEPAAPASDCILQTFPSNPAGCPGAAPNDKPATAQAVDSGPVVVPSVPENPGAELKAADRTTRSTSPTPAAIMLTVRRTR
ncbi:hypothetical protein Agub_g14641, partial [Astrephomene gubernaculifera]